MALRRTPSWCCACSKCFSKEATILSVDVLAWFNDEFRRMRMRISVPRVHDFIKDEPYLSNMDLKSSKRLLATVDNFGSSGTAIVSKSDLGGRNDI